MRVCACGVCVCVRVCEKFGQECLPFARMRACVCLFVHVSESNTCVYVCVYVYVCE